MQALGCSTLGAGLQGINVFFEHRQQQRRDVIQPAALVGRETIRRACAQHLDLVTRVALAPDQVQARRVVEAAFDALLRRKHRFIDQCRIRAGWGQLPY
ncbi:hypothetical protein D3C76_1561400 [compost metagenome]